MKQLYAPKTANYPRLKTDTCFSDYSNEYSYGPLLDNVFKFCEDRQLLDETLWKRFVDQFRLQPDNGRGWRGEYWGKMMRGACFVYSYTRNPELYRLLCDTVKDMASAIEEDGRMSTYLREQEFGGWDIWCRKYVLLGMQYFMEICEDEALKTELTDNMCRQLDYIMSKVGPEKILITKTTTHWRGLNSSSLLEPVVRLYTLTGKQEYLDYAKYIIDCGFTDISNIIQLVLDDDFMPYQYPITKAYEMISCFEGLLEYYRITGIEEYKTAVIRFADRVLETDFTVIGCCGCTHEQFDHSTVRQANTNNGIMQETCVTVTVMKFMYQLHLLTGDSKYVDAFETSLYNAYLGSLNTEQVIEPLILNDHPDWIAEPLPFGSYSPLTADTRGKQIGGLMIMPDNHYYGCCACIGSAGIGLYPKLQLMTRKDGFVLNLFTEGSIRSQTPAGQDITFQLVTGYPVDGKVSVKLTLAQPEQFKLLVRNPAWSKNTLCHVSSEVSMTTGSGYLTLERKWQSGDTVELELDMRVNVIRPIPYGTQIVMSKNVAGQNYVTPVFDREDPLAKRHIALQRGPVMLAQENRLGYSVDDPIDIAVNADETVDAVFPAEPNAPYENILEMQIPLTDGTMMTVTDYGSAGKLWNEESKTAVWMLTV